MKRTRGFTLIELMVGVLIGGFTVLVAAHVASLLVQQAAKGRQATDFNSRARMLGRQMRTDVRLTGIGSTGAVTADPNSIFGPMLQNTPGGGYPAIPVMIGLNNVAANTGGIPVLGNSDVVMMVVVNPAAHVIVDQTAPALTNQLTLDPAADVAPFVGCEVLYIVDHSTPGGSGRAQLAVVNSVAGSPFTIQDTLQFTVAAQSDIMCARLSTYWVADTDGDGVGNFLMRSDIRPGGPVTPMGGGVFVQYDAANDTVAPGVVDLQIAYSFSAEIYRSRSLNPDPARIWMFSATDPAPPIVPTPFDWFEVRQARFSIHAKRMRALDNHSQVGGPGLVNINQRAEDGGLFPVPLPASVQPEILTTSETLVNLRYYDFGTPGGVAAEPY